MCSDGDAARANPPQTSKSPARSSAVRATVPIRPRIPAIATRIAAERGVSSDLFEGGIFQHQHLLPDIGEIDRHQTVTPGSDDVADHAFSPFRIAHAIADGEVHAHAGTGRLVDHGLPPSRTGRSQRLSLRIL